MASPPSPHPPHPSPPSIAILRYRDDETLCKGVLDLVSNVLTGTVHQLVHAEEGFEYPSDDEVRLKISLKIRETLPSSLSRALSLSLSRALSLCADETFC